MNYANALRPPRRWERWSRSPALPDTVHTRDEVIAALEAIRLAGGGAVRLLGTSDAPETWGPERYMGLGDRRGHLMPTTLIRQLVAEEYAAVTTAHSVFDDATRSWHSVPVRIFWTRKGIERR